MLKYTLFLIVTGMLSSSIISANSVALTYEDKVITEKFRELQTLETYVSEHNGATLHDLKNSNEQSMVSLAKVDINAAHFHPGQNRFPSFREKPILYIGAGVLIIVIVTVYLVFGSGGYSSR
jgi:hypothetical protein